MPRLWILLRKNWIFLKKNRSTRETIALLVSIAIALVGGVWAVFTYVFPVEKPGKVSPKELSGIIEEATKGWIVSEQQRHTIDTLQANLGVNERALTAFFITLGENEVPLEQLKKKLLEIAGHYKELLAQAKPNPDDEPAVAKIKIAAREALEAGQLARADDLLEQLEKLQDSALETRQLERASTSARRGQLAMTQLRYWDAAQHFADAAKHVPEERTDVRLGYLDQEADALLTEGDERGDNGALAASIERYRILLTLQPRERVPLDWAMTENNLGNALKILGERESGTQRLEEAVAAYRAALQEQTHKRLPLEWAGTQNNLGNALLALGQRESGTQRLEEAVAAYRAALEERTRERVPLQWAMTQDNLGVALWRLGERESGTARLEEAVTAFRAALEEYTRERVPLQWAMTQSNLGGRS